ncbi:sarcosine oxidase subunit gamma family protein [Pelagibius sp. 7325]|uniref:sarcosine oxidase subunit gamma n=1 Tax=Pelagibius sp. 7325 TaxID=3131994 RepID=UPI0030EEE322
MIEPYLRQSALDHLGLAGRTIDAAGDIAVRLAEKPLPAAVNLRGDAGDPAFVAALRDALGVEPPTAPNTTATGGSVTLLWLGPDEWLAVEHAATPEAEMRLASKLRNALGDLHAAVTEVGEQYACIHIAGNHARDVIAKGCPLDLHPRVFGGTGHCAQSHLSKASIILHQVDDRGADGAAYDLYVRRSFSDYLWHWLESAAREYGLAVVAP